MKKILAIALSALMALSLAAAFAAEAAVPYVSVSADAKVLVDPDICYISLGVTTTDSTAAKASAANGKKMDGVIKAIKALGVADKDLSTSSLSVYPEYDYSEGKTPKLTGYRVSNTIAITVRDLAKVGTIVDTGLNAGATDLNNVQFDLEETDAYYIQALAAATKKLSAKANAIAGALGRKVGNLLSVSESGASYTPVYSDVRVTANAQNAAFALADGVGSTISAGKITVSASVSATYELN